MQASLLINDKWRTLRCKELYGSLVIVTIERNYRRIYDAKTGQPISGEFHKEYLQDEINQIRTAQE